jgi:hypothetical protein
LAGITFERQRPFALSYKQKRVGEGSGNVVLESDKMPSRPADKLQCENSEKWYPAHYLDGCMIFLDFVSAFLGGLGVLAVQP